MEANNFDQIRAQVRRLIQWVNHKDRVLFVNGSCAELFDIDAIDYEISDPRLTYGYTGDGEEHDLYLKNMASTEWHENEYAFAVTMKSGEGYNFEVYELQRVDFPPAP